MTTVYRVWSPSRGVNTLTTVDKDSAVHAVASLNDSYRKMNLKTDWRFQIGTVTEWKDAR